MRILEEFEIGNFLTLICVILQAAVLITVIPAIAFAQVRSHVNDFDETCSYADTLLGWYSYAMDPIDTLMPGDSVTLYPMLCEFGEYYAQQDTLAKVKKREIKSTINITSARVYHITKKGWHRLKVRFHVIKDGSTVSIRRGKVENGKWKNVGLLKSWVDEDSCKILTWEKVKWFHECSAVKLAVKSAIEFREGTDEDFTIEYISEIPTLTEWGLIIFGVVLLGFITWVFLRRRKAVVSLR